MCTLKLYLDRVAPHQPFLTTKDCRHCQHCATRWWRPHLLRSLVLTQCVTDGRTDGFAVAYAALAARCKNLDSNIWTFEMQCCCTGSRWLYSSIVLFMTMCCFFEATKYKFNATVQTVTLQQPDCDDDGLPRINEAHSRLYAVTIWRSAHDLPHKTPHSLYAANFNESNTCR